MLQDGKHSDVRGRRVQVFKNEALLALWAFFGH